MNYQFIINQIQLYLLSKCHEIPVLPTSRHGSHDLHMQVMRRGRLVKVSGYGVDWAGGGWDNAVGALITPQCQARDAEFMMGHGDSCRIIDGILPLSIALIC